MIELLSEYKLDPAGLRAGWHPNDEVEQLHQMRTRLMDLQARREAESCA
ncbi:hypothetical protein ACIA78_21360 [Streptomyces xanthochromogenes]